MDGGEADHLMIADLKTVGCNIPDDVKVAKDFKADVFVNCILRIMRTIDSGRREYPRQLSNMRAQRVNQSTQLVTILKEEGYSDDLSYHNLLYPNAVDTRKIFQWLLPRVVVVDPERERPVVWKLIENEIDFLTSKEAVWTPPFTAFSTQRGKNYYKLTPVSTRVIYSPYTPSLYPGGRKVLPEQKRYFSQFMPFFTAQPKTKASVAPSVLEYNIALNTEVQERENEWTNVGFPTGKTAAQWRKDKQTQILKTMAMHIRTAAAKKGGSIFSKALKVQQDSADARAQKFGKEEKETAEHVETEEDIKKRREREQAEADAKLAAAEARLQQVEQEIQVAGTEALQLTALLQKEAEKTVVLKKQYLEIRATLDLVKNASENMTKLQESIDQYRQKLVEWQGKWESKRQELVDGYRELKLQYSKREDEMQAKREEIKGIRAEIKTLLAANKEKEERYKQLVQIYKSTKDQGKRTTYTTKILVLVGTVKKYRVEINTILIDTKNVQKEINALTDTLSRTFADVEELIYKEAIKDTKDKPLADSYKSLVKLDEVFKELTDLFQKTGQATNATLFINDKIQKLEARTTSLNMEKIVEDLQQVQEENAKLKAKITQLKEQ